MKPLPAGASPPILQLEGSNGAWPVNVAKYLVEAYLADSPAALAHASESARLLAELDREIRYIRTTFLPGEESVFHVFEASSPSVVIAAANEVELPVERITEAFEDID